MKKLQDVSAFIFILCVTILAFVSILGVWKVLSDDVISKSVQTVILLAVVTIIITTAGKFFGSHEELPAGMPAGATPVPVMVNPAFTGIRRMTIATLIISVSLLALLGVLSIWEIMSGETLSKSLSSMTIIAFASVVIIMTCLQREDKKILQQKVSGWVIFLLIVIGWVFLKALLSF